ncbi:MAG TPA: hypothetical protein PKA76_02710 [Pirellulaceae bacterium]|nr:hypothetical protein [Pirellulaceae bacterium]HMP68233.1 hypothetical protein [Pirellulaceae bacterium]
MLEQLDTEDLADVRWLVSDDAAADLTQAYSELCRGTSSLALLRRLRKQFSVERARLIVQQAELRKRATAKFRLHDKMFFTPKGLEQATSENIAAYKARRMAAAPEIADLCCGIGGDLISLAQTAPTIGVDLDKQTSLIAEANLKVYNQHHACHATTVTSFDVTTQDFAEHLWVHIDPDRRVRGKRTTKLDWFQPSPAYLQTIVSKHKHVAIKLAPASNLHEYPELHDCEREFIGSSREVKQLVAWYGETKCSKRAVTATAIDSSGQIIGQFSTDDALAGDSPLSRSNRKITSSNEHRLRAGDNIYELHPTLVLAQLSETFCKMYDLTTIDMHSSLCIGPCFTHGLARGFRVVDQCSPDLKRIEAMARFYQVGNLEMKFIGVDVRTQQRMQRLKLDGAEKMVLFVARTLHGLTAIFAQRTAPLELS